MTDFEFRLEKVLELKSQHEAEAAGRLAEARQDEEEARHRRDALASARDAGSEKLKELHTADHKAGHLQALSIVLEKLTHKIGDADGFVHAAQEKVRSMLDDFSRAHRDRRALDELKARQRHSWERDVVRRDQKELDEFAVTRHARNNGNRSVERPGRSGEPGTPRSASAAAPRPADAQPMSDRDREE